MADQNFVVHDLTPEDVSAGVADGRYLLVDVREPNEVAVEAYPDAVVVPLSTFDPNLLPRDVPLIFNCGIGKRSALAVARAQQAGYAHDAHLAGGLAAWKAAGLPTVAGKK